MKNNLIFCFLLTIVMVLNIYAQEPVTGLRPIDLFAESIKGLRSSDPIIQRKSIEVLTQLRDTRAIPNLIEVATNVKNNVFIRTSAIDSLGILHSKEATEILCKLIIEDKEPQIRQQAAVSLGYIGDKSSIPYLIKGIDDPHDGTKYASIQTLGLIRSTEAIPSLISHLKNDNVNMRRSILNALGMIGDKSAAKFIRELLKDNNDTVRSEAARTLGLLNDKESIPDLKELLKDKDITVSIIAANALAKLDDNSGLDIAIKNINNKEDYLRIVCIETLGLIGDRKYIPILEKYLSDTNSQIKQTAQYSIDIIKSKYPEKKKSGLKK